MAAPLERTLSRALSDVGSPGADALAGAAPLDAETPAALNAPLLKVAAAERTPKPESCERCSGEEGAGCRDGQHAFAKLALPVFLPQIFVYSVSMLVTPVLPHYVMKELGQTEWEVGVAAACVSVAPALLDMPGNLLADWLGANMLGVVGGVCLVLCGLVAVAGDASRSISLFLLARLLNGMGQSSSQMSKVLLVAQGPADLRGKAFSTIGGLQRFGSLVGPFLGGQLAASLSMRGVFLAQSACGVVALGLALFPVLCPDSTLLPHFLRSSGEANGGQGGSKGAGGGASVASMLRCAARNWRDLATAGLALLVLCLLRQAKDLLVVLKVDALEGGPRTAGVVVALTYAVDFSFFPVSALLMTRWGRKWSMGIALTLMGTACALLATPLASSLSAVTAVACLAGAGNGVSSGLAMCYGSDMATRRVQEGRARSNAEYMGPWRQLLDVGSLVGPLLVGTAAAAVSLPTAAGTCAAVAFAATAFAIVKVEETATLPR